MRKSDSYVHESSEVEESAQVGEGTKIWHFSHVMSGAVIGKNCVLSQNVFVGRDVHIGNGCKIQNNVSVYNGVTLEDNVFCGPSMVFTNVRNPRANVERKDEFTEIMVREGATLGANSTIVGSLKPPRTIGRYAFVGAGAVVTKDVLDYALVIGNPARQIGWACECGEIVTKDIESKDRNILECNRCEQTYVHEGRSFDRQNED